MKSDQEIKKALSGKRVLLIGVNFYHYNQSIIDKLNSVGASVQFFYERDISIKYALVNYFFPDRMDEYRQRHYRQILKKIRNDAFDYLLVIRGLGMKPEFVEAVRALNPGIKTILYEWDSLHHENYVDMIPHFNRTATFDPVDARELGLPYVPTFYTEEMASLPPVPIKYDFFFYASYTYEKYTALLKLKEWTDKQGYTLKIHLYLSRKAQLRERLRGYKLDKQLLSPDKMDKNLFVKLFNESNIIVDVSSARQTGLSMRMVDVLGSGKRAMTTNVRFRDDPDYDPEQVHIFDPEHVDLPQGFLTDRSFKKKDYSLNRWLKSLLLE